MQSKNLMMNQRGMTLVEVIAVVILISLIMVVVGRSVLSQSDSAKAELNQVKIERLKGALATYKLKYNVYPDKIDELVKGSAKMKKSGKIFTPMAQEDDLVDVYQTPFVYEAKNNNRSYAIKSLGADGLPGGDGVNSDVTFGP